MLSLLLLAAVQTSDDAQLIPSFFTGERLYEICRRPNNGGQCSMYVAGALDGMFYARSRSDERQFCPDAMTNREAARIVTRYLEEHPQIRHLAAARVVRLAIGHRLTCDPGERER